ncbi:MAG: tetratricopeptide repeat protein, partial [Nitrospinota bacterium]
EGQMRVFSILILVFLPTCAFAWTFVNPPAGANDVSSAHSRRAIKLFADGDVKRSFEHFEKAINEAIECCIRETGVNAVFYWNLGVYYEKMNEYEKAKPFFKYARQFLYVYQ